MAAPVQGQMLAAAPIQAAPVQAVQTLALVRALAPAPRVPTQAQVEPQAQVLAPLAQVVEAQLHRDGDVVFRVFGCSIELAVRQFEISG